MARIVLDNDFPLGAGEELRRLGHDVASARSKSREDCHDDDQLLYAATESRILVTHNRRDFRLLHNAWQRWSRAWDRQRLHAGILVLPQERSWTYQHYATAIDAYLNQHESVTNHLHVCDGAGSWAQHPDP